MKVRTFQIKNLGYVETGIFIKKRRTTRPQENKALTLGVVETLDGVMGKKSILPACMIDILIGSLHSFYFMAEEYHRYEVVSAIAYDKGIRYEVTGEIYYYGSDDDNSQDDDKPMGKLVFTPAQ